MLLTDVYILDNVQIIEESSSKGTMRISGCFQRANEANNNKRVYSKHLLERELGKVSDMVVNRRMVGELDHPSHDAVKLANVSHLVTKLGMKGTEVLGEAELLNTPAGLTAQALIKGGVKIGISSRGMGTLTENPDGTKDVNEDYSLVTFDLVADPSTRGAYPDVCESTEAKSKEIVETTMKKAISENVFLTLLKKKLNEQAPGRFHVSMGDAMQQGAKKRACIKNGGTWEGSLAMGKCVPKSGKSDPAPNEDTSSDREARLKNLYNFMKLEGTRPYRDDAPRSPNPRTLAHNLAASARLAAAKKRADDKKKAAAAAAKQK